MDAKPSAAPTGANIERIIRYNDAAAEPVYGDTWVTAWGEDDILYSTTDDTSGFGQPFSGDHTRNLAINHFGFTTPPGLRGSLVNDMAGFGVSNKLGADGACWKANSLACIDGTLYLSVSRHWYGKPERNGIQISRDASILRSDDKGKSWNRLPENGEPLAEPTFVGDKFAVPYFVQYGQDGKAPQGVDEADRYVYALSADGYWDNGNAMYLGRVAREKLPALNGADWEFYVGSWQGQPKFLPGSKGLDVAQPILQAARRCGQSGAFYVNALNRYILPQWSYPKLNADEFNTHEVLWEWYEAPYPWGPWHCFQRWEWQTEGYYNPWVPNKFISADGKHLWALATGDFMTYAKSAQETLYTLFMMEITLQVE